MEDDEWHGYETERNVFESPIAYEKTCQNLTYNEWLIMVFESKHFKKAYNTTIKTKSLRKKIEMFSKSINKRKDAKIILKKFIKNCCIIGNKQELNEEAKERQRIKER